MKIILVRHGETDWNILDKINGLTDNELNDNGILQAHKTGEKLRSIQPTKVLASPLKRAFKTVQIISEDNKWKEQIIIDKSFIERDFGELEGHPNKDYYDLRDQSIIKGLEKTGDLENRVCSAIDNVAKSNNLSDTIVVGTHGHVIKAALVSLFPEKYDYEYNLLNGAVLVLNYDGEKLEFLDLK